MSCFSQVNQENVVKVGHRQVVNMIRQGGNRLLIKVVTVSRNLDPEDTARKKGKSGLSVVLCVIRWRRQLLTDPDPVSKHQTLTNSKQNRSRSVYERI